VGYPHRQAALLVELALLARRLFPRGDPSGLEPNEAQVVISLFLEPGQTVTELSEGLVLAKTTVSHAVTHLQRGGLVDESRDIHDGRRMLQSLTARGNKLAEQLVDLGMQRLART